MNLSKSFLKPKSEVVKRRKKSAVTERSVEISEENLIAAVESFMRSMKLMDENEQVILINNHSGKRKILIIKEVLD